MSSPLSSSHHGGDMSKARGRSSQRRDKDGDPEVQTVLQKRQKHLLNELKITDNKMYELLHEKIINSLQNGEDDGKKEYTRRRTPALTRTPTESPDYVSEDTPPPISAPTVPRSQCAVTYYKARVDGIRRLVVKIRYKKHLNGLYKIEKRGRPRKGTTRKQITEKNTKGRLSKKSKKSTATIIKIKSRLLKPNLLENYENDELPFNGILSYEDGNTYFTLPKLADQEIFNRALSELQNHVIDVKWCNDATDKGGEPMFDDTNESDSQRQTTPGTPSSFVTAASRIKSIVIANHEIKTWYTAPYPEEYSSKPVLFICQYCLKYMNSAFIYQRHLLKCTLTHPPGYEVYRDESVLVFEIDGRKNTIYCQNLCLLLKLFLNSKTLYYDVDPFIFYVLVELNSNGESQFVGYFSKEKLNSTNYNVSCILTLPIYQRKGYGNLLIDFSYLLTRREFKLGTPEKPLSDLGLLSYRNYWCITICYKLKELSELRKPKPIHQISINDIANLTGIMANDVITLLEYLEFLVRNTNTGEYAIKIELNKIDQILNKWESKSYHRLKHENLLFKPVIFGPSGGINTTTTMVVTAGDDDSAKNNQQTSGISLITNFLRDDIEDNRDMETQLIEEILEKNREGDSNHQKLSDYVVCYPGMDLGSVENDQNGTDEGVTRVEEGDYSVKRAEIVDDVDVNEGDDIELDDEESGESSATSEASDVELDDDDDDDDENDYESDDSAESGVEDSDAEAVEDDDDADDSDSEDEVVQARSRSRSTTPRRSRRNLRGT